MNRRWITLDVAILNEAMENKKIRDNGGEPETVFSFANSKAALPETLKFNSIDVTEVPLTDPHEIVTFEDARQVFLRAVTRLEVSKKAFPLDGTSRRLHDPDIHDRICYRSCSISPST